MMSCMVTNTVIDGIPHKQIVITFPANGEVNVQEYTDMMFNAMAGGIAIDGDDASVDVANAITELDNSGRRELLNEVFSTLMPDDEEE